MATFTDIFVELDKLGVLDSLIPFIIVFTIVFAVLEKTQILGIGKKGMNTILALAIGLMFVIPHIIGSYPAGADPVEIMNTAVPNVVLVSVAIIMALVLAGVFGFQFVGGSITGFVLIFAVLVVAFFFGDAAGLWSNIFPNIGSETRALIITIIVFGIIIFFITRDDKPSEAVGFFKGLNDTLRKI